MVKKLQLQKIKTIMIVLQKVQKILQALNWIYIFNHILDTNIEPLPHEVYGILGENNLYNFIDLNHMIDSKDKIND